MAGSAALSPMSPGPVECDSPRSGVVARPAKARSGDADADRARDAGLAARAAAAASYDLTLAASLTTARIMAWPGTKDEASSVVDRGLDYYARVAGTMAPGDAAGRMCLDGLIRLRGPFGRPYLTPPQLSRVRTLEAAIAGRCTRNGLYTNGDAFYAAHALQAVGLYESVRPRVVSSRASGASASSAPEPTPPAGALGGIEVEFYGFTLVSPANRVPLKHGTILLTSDNLELTVEWGMRGDGMCLEIATKPKSTATSRVAMDDLAACYNELLAVTADGAAISLDAFRAQINSKLQSALHATDRGRDAADPMLAFDSQVNASRWVTDAQAPQVQIARHATRPPHDVWVQYSTSSSTYPYAYPASLHKLVDAEAARGALVSAELVERHETQWPVAAKLQRMHLLANHAQRIVRELQAEIRPPHDAGLKPRRVMAKLTGFVAQLGQWILFPSFSVEDSHPESKDRVLLLPHTRPYDVFSACLSPADHRFIKAWQASNPRVSFEDRIIRGFGLHPEMDLVPEQRLTLRGFLTELMAPRDTLLASIHRSVFQPGTLYYGTNPSAECGEYRTAVVEVRNPVAAYAPVFESGADIALHLKAGLDETMRLLNPTRDERRSLRSTNPAHPEPVEGSSG